MEIKEKYEKAEQRLKSHDKKYQHGVAAPTGFSVEAKRADLVSEMIRWRNKLVETGEWEGPIPIPVKAKYRRV